MSIPKFFIPFIELLYQIPYRGYNMQIKKLSEGYHWIQVNFMTIKGPIMGLLRPRYAEIGLNDHI